MTEVKIAWKGERETSLYKCRPCPYGREMTGTSFCGLRLATSVSGMPAQLLVVRDYLEMKVRTFLTRRKLRKKRSVG